MAEGKSYGGIAKAAAPSEAAVERNMITIFRKLELVLTSTDIGVWPPW
jgi:hypothetical protein